mgnify:CR=1 FL=1
MSNPILVHLWILVRLQNLTQKKIVVFQLPNSVNMKLGKFNMYQHFKTLRFFMHKGLILWNHMKYYHLTTDSGCKITCATGFCISIVKFMANSFLVWYYESFCLSLPPAVLNWKEWQFYFLGGPHVTHAIMACDQWQWPRAKKCFVEIGVFAWIYDDRFCLFWDFLIGRFHGFFPL